MAKHKFINKKHIILATIVIVALLIPLFLYLNKAGTGQPDKSNGINYNPPSKVEKDEAEQAKLDQNSKPGANEGGQSTEGRLEISKLEQNAGTKDLLAQTRLYDTTWKKCTLVLAKGNYTVTKTVDVLFNSDFSTCMGFSIDINEFPEGGQWSAILYAEKSDGKTKSTASKIIDITK